MGNTILTKAAQANNRADALDGLVLAGGKSSRLGQDKTLIKWQGTEQKYFLADLMSSFCRDVFISVRADQEASGNSHYRYLKDTYSGIGPYGAILSAFKFRPDSAWLVVACDLPLVDKPTLEYLIANRQAESVATTFQSPHDGLPEPLITIWEPKCFALLLSYLDEGFTCPRKALIRSGQAHVIQPPNPGALTNVNTPEDYALASQMMAEKMASGYER